MNKVTLLPCPFCGKPGDIEQGPASQASGSHCAYRGWCDQCCYGLDWTTDHRESITAWNTRATPAPDSEKLREALEAIAKFVDDFRAPWGSWKTAWWEGEVSDDAAFTDDNALMHIANLARRASQQGAAR